MSGQRLLAALSRVVLMATGMFSVWWGISTFPIFWHDARLEHTAYAITNGGQFKREVLQNLLADADLDKSWARPEALRSAAIVRFGLVEQASVADKQKPPGPLVDQLEASIRRSLSAAPADSFLWLALFLSTRMKEDRSKDDFGFLRMSYRVGPHEGWVAGRRNYIAFDHFPELPQDLADAAVTEFRDLVVPVISSRPPRSWSVRVGPSMRCCCVALRMRRSRRGANWLLWRRRGGMTLRCRVLNGPNRGRGDKVLRRPCRSCDPHD